MWIENLLMAGGLLGAYFLGSINSAILVCRAMALPSPCRTGSCNPGATNVLRLGGKLPALLTFAGDLFKGVLPVLLAKHYQFSPAFCAYCGLAAVAGHIWPVFFGFKGGKGVATAMGVFFALNLWMGLIALLAFLTTLILFPYASLASLVAMMVTPVFAGLWINVNFFFPLGILAVLIFFRHRSNIKRLCLGSEPKIGKRS